MVAFNYFNSFVEAVAEKVHNLGSDTLKVALTNVAPVATNAVFADITEIAAGNGYTAGGKTTAQVTSVQTAGTYKLVLTDQGWTATGGAMASFRYVVLYNFTATNKELIGFWDYASVVTRNDTETFTTDFDAAAGVLTIGHA